MYKETMTEQRYLVMVEFVPQGLLHLGKSGKQQELVYSTTSIIVS
jgi:hypothetical protein